MSNPRQSNARGKWLAGVLLAMGIIAGVAECKFRKRVPNLPTTIPATQPAQV